MSKSDISVETDSILGSANDLLNLANRFSNLGSNAINNFDGMGRVYPDNIKNIANQANAEIKSIISEATLLRNGAQSMSDTDNALASEFDKSFSPPLDFTANNVMDTNKFNATIIGKVDGTSVNEGHKTEKASEIDETTVAAKALTDISGDQTKAQTYDDTTIIGKSILGNISGDQTKAQTYDDSTSIGNTKLKSANLNQNLDEQVYDDSSNINRNVLQNMNGAQSVAQTYDDSSNINRNVLQNMNGAQSVAQTYGDSTVIGKSILGSINKNAGAGTSSFDDDAIAAAVENKKATEMNKAEDAALNASKEM